MNKISRIANKVFYYILGISLLLGIGIFGFGILKNLENDWLEWRFSPFTIEAPFYLDILQVGQICTLDGKYFFYRPEIGFGYSMFTLSYGYNVFFKKGTPDNISRHMINLGVRYVFDSKR